MKVTIKRLDIRNITFRVYDESGNLIVPHMGREVIMSNGKIRKSAWHEKYYGNLKDCLEGAKRYITSLDITDAEMTLDQIDKLLNKYQNIKYEVGSDV